MQPLHCEYCYTFEQTTHSYIISIPIDVLINYSLVDARKAKFHQTNKLLKIYRHPHRTHKRNGFLQSQIVFETICLRTPSASQHAPTCSKLVRASLNILNFNHSPRASTHTHHSSHSNRKQSLTSRTHIINLTQYQIQRDLCLKASDVYFYCISC